MDHFSISFFKKDLFIYFWLHWVFTAALRLSLVVLSGGYSLLRCTGFSLQWLLLFRSTGSRHVSFSSYGMRAQQMWLMGSRAQAQQLWCMGLVAPRHVGSFRTRARTHVPFIGRQILNHCATREVPYFLIWTSLLPLFIGLAQASQCLAREAEIILEKTVAQVTKQERTQGIIQVRIKLPLCRFRL